MANYPVEVRILPLQLNKPSVLIYWRVFEFYIRLVLFFFFSALFSFFFFFFFPSFLAYFCRFMGQKKLQRFAEVLTFPNVLQYPENIQGTWKTFFHNANPITLELACGKGEYAVGLGRLFPERNFLGLILKATAFGWAPKRPCRRILPMWASCAPRSIVLELILPRAKCRRSGLTFPDPQLRTSKAGKRLTSTQIPAFIPANNETGRYCSPENRFAQFVPFYQMGDRTVRSAGYRGYRQCI